MRLHISTNNRFVRAARISLEDFQKFCEDNPFAKLKYTTSAPSNQPGYYIEGEGWMHEKDFLHQYHLWDADWFALTSEQQALTQKIEELHKVITSVQFCEIVPDSYDRYLLSKQYSYMKKYSETLDERIQRLNKQQ